MKSILVATDFSESSAMAGVYAGNLVKQTGAELTLLHAYLLPTPVSEVPYVMISVDEIQRDNEKQARQQAEYINQRTGVAVKTMVNIGMPADEIVYQARELESDLIVLGMRGENKGIDKLIGSTTVAVIRKSHIPVLVVPQNSDYAPIQQITYATDFSYTMNPRCLEMLQQIVRLNPGAKLNVVNIQKPGEIMTPQQVNGKIRLEPMLQSTLHEHFTLENASVEDGLQEFLTNHHSQLLVMVAHKHSWWQRLVHGSHTKQMAYKSNIPLLVLQDKD
jgi:nucleotide-binding universal stress UspA family protein